MGWPSGAEALAAEQRRLAAEPPPMGWDRLADGRPLSAARLIGGCFVCFRPDGAGELACAAAVVLAGRRLLARAESTARVTVDYQPGLLALREGGVLEEAVRALDPAPEVVLVNGTGRDHPRQAGLAVHLGAVLGRPTVGVTHRPLVAAGEFAAGPRGARWPVRLTGEVVGYWVVTRTGRRPVVAHAGWQTSAAGAVDVVLAASGRARTPEPVRRARELARRRRAEYVSGQPEAAS